MFDALKGQEWPGNVRELINELEYALASADQDPTLYPKHLPPKYRAELLQLKTAPKSKPAAGPLVPPEIDADFPRISDYRSEVDKQYLQALVTRAKGDRGIACRLSGLSQSRLYDLLKKHSLSLTESIEN